MSNGVGGIVDVEVEARSSRAATPAVGMRWNALAGFAGPAAGVLFTIALANLLPTSDFGVLVTAMTTTTVAVGVFSLGLDRAALAGVAQLGEEHKTGALRAVVVMNLVGACLAGVAVAAFWRYAPLLESDERLRLEPVLVGAMAACETWRLVTSDLLRLRRGARASFLAGIGVRTGGSLLVLVVLRAAVGEVTLARTVIVLTAVSGALALRSTLPLVQPPVRSLATSPPALPAVSRSVLRQGTEVMLAGLGRLCITNVDVLVVAGFYDERVVASYALATRVARTLGTLSTAANVTVIPQLSAARSRRDLGDTDRWRVGEAVAQPPATAAFWSGLLLGGAIALGADHTVSAVLGREFALVPDIARVLILGQVVNLATGVSGAFLLVGDRVRVTLLLTLVAAVAVLSTQYAIGATKGSIILLAAVGAAGFAGENVAAWAYVRRRWGVNSGPALDPRVILQLRHHHDGPVRGAELQPSGTT